MQIGIDVAVWTEYDANVTPIGGCVQIECGIWTGLLFCLVRAGVKIVCEPESMLDNLFGCVSWIPIEIVSLICLQHLKLGVRRGSAEPSWISQAGTGFWFDISHGLSLCAKLGLPCRA